MLSVNSANQPGAATETLAFKGKPNATDLKKFYQVMEQQRIDAFLKNPDIPKEVKQEFLIRETSGDVIKLFKDFMADKFKLINIKNIMK